ncbi:response regulator transcription factor [Aquimarina agarilytica]|uniref:response regulator transcription factor n=1 Tax=Aquimarina agarilytica TaxID=1087449 RepID=UPI00028882A2|nr:response regulator transcription factor [Aquimarina agarilytica]
MKQNLIIVDDHKMFSDGLLSIFDSKKEYNILLTAKDGKHIIKYLEINTNEKIDLVITDIAMPEVDGIELTKYIKKKDRNIKILIVSMHNNVEMIDTLTKLEVDGYIPKNAEKKELLRAVESILKGEKYFSKEITNAYIENKFLESKKEKIKLTKREIDVITLIAQEFTTKEIADKLCLSKHTIESYRKNLIAKLSVKNLAGLTRYAMKMKYIK